MTGIPISFGTTLQLSTQEMGFYPDLDPEANIWRFRDRVFIGDACAATGNWNEPRGGAWLTLPADGADWAIRDSALVSMSPNGKIAIAGLSKSGQGAEGATIGVAAIAINDRAGDDSWAIYAEAQHEPGAGWSTCLEAAAKNKAGNATDTSYTNQGGVFGAWLAAFGDPAYGGTATNPSNAAIVVLNNMQTWNKGIVFKKDALTGCNGVTGSATAIELAKGHTIQQRMAGDYPGGYVLFDVGTQGAQVGLLFADNAVVFVSAAGKPVATIYHSPNGVNSIVLRDGPAGSPAEVQSYGDDANIDLKLTPKGTGRAQFGNYQTHADAAITGYIEIKDATGVLRKLAVIA